MRKVDGDIVTGSSSDTESVDPLEVTGEFVGVKIPRLVRGISSRSLEVSASKTMEFPWEDELSNTSV